jgi:type I restriction enzyme S subunit
VRWYAAGVFAKDSQRGEQIAAKTLFQVQNEDIIYSRLFAWKGSFGVVPAEHDGCVASNEFPTYRANEELLPAYYAIWSSRPVVWELAEESSTGTTANSRLRLGEDDFLDLEINLPSAEEQREIIVAVDAVDELVAAYRAEADAAATALRAARDHLAAHMKMKRLGDVLARIEAGKSPSALDRPPNADERGVLKVSAVRPGEFRPDEAKTLDSEASFPDRARVKSGDVLITRANTRELVGAVCRVPRDYPNLYLCDKTLRLVPRDELLDPAFLVHTASTTATRAQIEDAATGSSDSMKNISHSVILDLQVPVPETLEAQRKVAAQLDILAETAHQAEVLFDKTRVMRAALVESLISGEWQVAPRLGGAKPVMTG